jgi:hypothetical protein
MTGIFMKSQAIGDTNLFTRAFKSVPFWLRSVITAAACFVALLSIRFDAPPLSLLFVIFVFLGMAWTAVAAFRKQPPTFRARKPFPRFARIILLLTVIPILWVAAAGAGTVMAEAVAPLSQQELAERAEQAALDKAAADERARAEAEQAVLDKAAADERARAEADQRATQEAAEAAEAAARERADLEALRTTDPLEYMTVACEGDRTSRYLEVDLEGKAFFVSSGSSTDPDGRAMVVCIESAMDFSSPLRASIAATNALAGTKTWSENGFDYQWTYHPDAGLNLSGQAQ